MSWSFYRDFVHKSFAKSLPLLNGYYYFLEYNFQIEIQIAFYFSNVSILLFQ